MVALSRPTARLNEIAQFLAVEKCRKFWRVNEPWPRKAVSLAAFSSSKAVVLAPTPNCPSLCRLSVTKRDHLESVAELGIAAANSSP